MRTVPPYTFLLLVRFSYASAVSNAGQKAKWKLERTFERQPMNNGHSEGRPWPLLVPKRDQETVIFRFHYGFNEDYICREILSDEETFLVDNIAVKDVTLDNTLQRRLDTTSSNETLPPKGSYEESHPSVQVSYENIYDTLIFLAVAWLAGNFALLLGMPTLVGEIIAGFLLGPPLANFVPLPAGMSLIGEIGLIGLVLQAGIETDVAQLKETGIRSLIMAFTGAMIPLAIGIGLGTAAGIEIRAAIALGSVFSPTSFGVASNALNAGNVLNTPVGQLIVAACVLDDLIALVILSMLRVVIDPNAQLYQYFIPIISSVGFLLLLGWAGLTWLPNLIENRILPMFSEKTRPFIAFGLMMMLLLTYLPTLYYSRSSYLTGAFLAGLTFSQIPSIHITFVNEMSSLMSWLLRLFFAATIGFQIPITLFSNPYIIQWGFIFCKLPLGAFVPRFQPNVPEGFPFNPYIRDVIYASVGMTCRGEFSFVIASFGLSAGLFTTEVYTSIVFAVLLSSITSPFALLTIIRYYNRKSEELLKHLMDDDEGDGKIPLYLAIQVRTPNQWGLQETIQSAVKRADLIVIDHRSWHPRGIDALVMTELYVEDSNLRLPPIKVKDLPETRVDVEANSGVDISSIMDTVDDRCSAVKKVLVDVLGIDEHTRIVVTLWQPNAVHNKQEKLEASQISLFERLKNEAQTEMLNHEWFGIHLPGHPNVSRHETAVPLVLGEDMWANDKVAQDVVLADARDRIAPTALAACYPYARNRKSLSDLTGFRVDGTESAEQHLIGFVRHNMNQESEVGTPLTKDNAS